MGRVTYLQTLRHGLGRGVVRDVLAQTVVDVANEKKDALPRVADLLWSKQHVGVPDAFQLLTKARAANKSSQLGRFRIPSRT